MNLFKNKIAASSLGVLFSILFLLPAQVLAVGSTGDQCQDTSDCLPALICSAIAGHTCQPPGGEGAVCQYTSDCRSGLTCLLQSGTTKICKAPTAHTCGQVICAVGELCNNAPNTGGLCLKKSTKECKNDAEQDDDTLCRVLGTDPNNKCMGGSCYLTEQSFAFYQQSQANQLPVIKSDIELFQPKTNIKLPTLSGGFSDVSKNVVEEPEGTFILIPWIGEYMGAIFNFALGIVSIVAVVMIIIQGAKVVVSAGGSAKSEAYKGITKAVIGLIVMWGSYVILYTINPELVRFKSLKILYIEQEDLPAFEEMQTTEFDTTNISDSGSFASTGSVATPAYTGSYSSAYPDCPLPLTSPFNPSGHPESEPRNKEFFNSVSKIVTGGSVAERVKQVADAALKCNVHFGSCGRTAGTIYRLARANTGAYDPSCLFIKGGCSILQSARGMKSLPKEIVLSTGEKYNCPTCSKTQEEAMKKAAAGIRAAGIPGWPDEWANELQPGDSYWIYNANSLGVTSIKKIKDKKGQVIGEKTVYSSGLHTGMFLGWKNGDASSGWAITLNGSAGKPARLSETCLKTACGDKMKPLIKTFRPN